MDENLYFEKSGLSHVHSFVIVIRSAYFGAQKHRKYAKNVGVNRSAIDTRVRHILSLKE